MKRHPPCNQACGLEARPEGAWAGVRLRQASVMEQGPFQSHVTSRCWGHGSHDEWLIWVMGS